MEKFKQIGTGICFILVPLLLIAGFASHQNLCDLTPPAGNVSNWVSEFHNNTSWRIAHITVMWATLPMMVMFLGFMNLLKNKAGWLSFIASSLGIIGCFMLAADKGALGLVPTAFDTLPEAQFQQMLPGLETMISYKGYLWMAKLYFLFPVGMLLIALALLKSRIVPLWQGAAILIGSLLLFNPDIDLISLIASIFLGIGLVPIGISMIRKS